MSTYVFEGSFLSGLKCRRSEHENHPIEFICDLPGCQERLTCLHCLLNEHASHFEGMTLLTKFFDKYRGSSSSCKEKCVIPLANEDPISTIKAFSEKIELQKSQILNEMKATEMQFKKKIMEILQAISYSHESTVSKFKNKLEEIVEKTEKEKLYSTNSNSQIEISNKQQLFHFLNKKYGKVKEEKKNDCNLESLIASKIISANPLSINSHILNHVKRLISHPHEIFKDFNEFSIERFAFTKMKNFSFFPNFSFKTIREESMILTKHKKPIYKLLFFENETKFATASDDASIMLWETKSNSVYATLNGHTDRVWTIILLERNRLASASSDHKIRIWNLKTYSCENILIGHNGFVCTLLELPKNLLVSGSQDNRIKVWNSVSAENISTFKGEKQGKIMTLTFSFPNKLIVGSGSDINLYDFDSGKLEDTMSGHSSLVRDLLLVNESENLLSASDDHHIILWSLTSKSQLLKFVGHTLSANKLLLWSENEFLSAGDDGNILFWNIKGSSCKPEHKLIAGRSWITSMTMRSDGKLFSVGAEKTIKIWSSSEN